MNEFLLVYVVVVLLSNGFGISVISSALPTIKEKITKKGYNVEKKNFIPALNDICIKALLVFIPFYYLFKALSLIQGDAALEKVAQQEIDSGKYNKVSDVEPEEVTVDTPVIKEKTYDKSVIKEEDFIIDNLNSRFYSWDEPTAEKYVARKNDNSIFNNEETPIDFITRTSTNNDVLNISKFEIKEENDLSEDTILKQPVEEKQKTEITNDDLANILTKIDPKVLATIIKDSNSLDSLKEQLLYESNNNILVLEKDVA